AGSAALAARGWLVREPAGFRGDGRAAAQSRDSADRGGRRLGPAYPDGIGRVPAAAAHGGAEGTGVVSAVRQPPGADKCFLCGAAEVSPEAHYGSPVCDGCLPIGEHVVSMPTGRDGASLAVCP